MKERIALWKQMDAEGNPEAMKFLEEITAQARAEGKIQEMNEALAYLLNEADKHLDNVEESFNAYTMHERMGSLTEVINIAYIARNYFGKTRQWLYQRLKCQVVNGKPASFTPEEEATFIYALNDIGLKISSFTHSA